MNLTKTNKKLLFTLIVVGVLLIMLLGVTKSYIIYQFTNQKLEQLLAQQQQTDIQMTAAQNQNIKLQYMGHEISIDPKQNNEFSLEELTTEFPIRLQFSNFEDYDIWVNHFMLQDGYIEQLIEKISFGSPSLEIKFRNKETGQETFTYLCTYPSDMPQIVAFGTSPYPGRYYFVAENYLIKMNTDGTLAYFKKEDQTAVELRDFRKFVTESGLIRYSYFKAFSNPRTTNEVGYYVIMDEEYNIIDKLDYMGKSEKLFEYTAMEGHDYLYLDDGHYVYTTYYMKHVNNIPDDVPHDPLGAVVSAAILQEVKDGEVIWEWDSSDYPELYELSIEHNDYFNTINNESDYMHLNSIYKDPKDGNYICSFRHLSAVLKLDSKTGEIIWILGGLGDQFGLTEEQKFSHQHHAYYTENGTITLYDNANDKGYSRAMEFLLDEENKKVLWSKSYEAGTQKRLYMGSAQRITPDRDVFLIGWGGRMPEISSDILLSEIDFTDHRLLFQVNCPTDNYRVYKFDS